MLRKVYLEITNVCNLNCAFCPGTKRPPRFLSVEDFRLLAGKLRGHTEYLYFHLMGEPLLHPDLPLLLDVAGALGFKVMLTTNGTLLPKRKDELLAAPALHKVNISLQSFEANAGGELAAYLRGCTDFAAAAAKEGKRCELRLWNRGGWETMNDEIRALLAEAFPEPWETSRNGFKLRERIWLEPGDYFDWPDLALPSLDREGAVPLGNLFTQELGDIMSTERARAIYEGFSRRRAVEPLCQGCGYARRFT